jgi:hypothetical protein
MNLDAGIKAFVIYKSKMNGLPNANELCEDAVMFGHAHDCPRLYIDYQDKIDRTRVSHGELRINPTDIEQFKKNFKTLMRMTIPEHDMYSLLKSL